MRVERTVEVNGKPLRILARLKGRRGDEHTYSVRVWDQHYFRDQVVVVDGPSTDEAVSMAVAGFLGTGRSSTVKKQQIKVGQEYLCKIGRNDVKVVAVSVPAMGSITLKTVATHKTVKIADPARLKAVPGGHAITHDEAAPVAAPVTETPKTTKAAKGRHAGEQGAPQAKKKRTSLMDAAAKVVEEAEQVDLPMSTTKMVELAMSKGYWSPAKGGKTPANTLYSMILRDMTKHGGDAKFRRAEDRFGRGRFFLNR